MSDLLNAFKEAVAEQTAEQAKAIFLGEYVDLVSAHPTIAATAHERIYNMIMAQGSKPGNHPDEISYNFFSEELYGLDVPLEKFVRYFDSAAMGQETKRRILLMWGPPGGAKSTIASLIKQGLETYSYTDDGAVYAIEGCPMHEEPLHLIPQRLRDDASKKIGRPIEGKLCPVCEHRLREDYNGDFLSVPIRRIYLSEAGRVGIGTFEPADPKTQSMEQLTGGIDYAKISKYGSEAHPLSLDWAGEFSKANRGVFEAVEFLKLEKEFRNGFLTAAQEKQFKPAKFGYVDLDCVILAHTNEAEYRRFMADPTNEALRDRMISLAVPYNTRLTDEVKIYEKLLTRQKSRQVHIAPHTLEAAGMVAVLSRLEPFDGLELMEKLKLYDGEETGEWKLVQIPELKRATDHEGMTGIGPRAVVNALADMAVAKERKGVGKGTGPYLTAIAALMAMMDYVEHLDVDRSERETLKKFVIDARTEIDRDLKDEVRKAFVPAFTTQTQNILENYLTNVEAYLQDTTVRDPITKEDHQPDEKLMRAIEERVSPSIPETAKDTFRAGVFVKIGMMKYKAKGSKALKYNSDLQLGRAIEEYLFEEMKDVIRITVSKVNPDPEQVKRLNEVIRVMVTDRGYNDQSANETIEYVGQKMNR